MLRFILIALVSLSAWAQGETEPQLPRMFENTMSNRMVNYRIRAKLNTQNKTLTATQWIEWRNMTRYDTSTLRFHLFQNAFKNTESAYSQMAPAYFRDSIEDQPQAWGFIQIDDISYTVQETQFEHPFVDSTKHPAAALFTNAIKDFQIGQDPDFPKDQSTATLFMKKPVKRGQSVWLKLTFTVKLPEPSISRSGTSGDYMLFGQWFPKIGFFENGKWICNPYNPYGEFYANFGVYDVLLDVPENYQVGATGIPILDHTINNRRLARFLAEDVIDFAWTTSPHFKRYEDRAGETDIVLLIQPEHDHLAQRHLDATKAALAYFDKLLGPFPYPRITVVDPPADDYGTSGMEYPMFVTAGTYSMLPGDQFIEAVIAHEIAHNYFQSVLASNEFAAPWMDEGFAEYLDTRFLAHYNPPNAAYFSSMGWHYSSHHLTRRSYLRRVDRPAPALAANQYQSYRDYGFAAYTKPAMLLHTLQGVIGQTAMDRLLASYYERFRFRHPQPKDFFTVVAEVAGKDNLAWFKQGLQTSAWVNYRVVSMKSESKTAHRGFGFHLDIDNFLKDRQDEPVNDEQPEGYVIKVQVQRQGDLRIPSTVRLTYEDETSEDISLDAEESFHYIQLERSARLKHAAVDPDRQLFIDRNWLDNSKTSEPSTAATRSLVETWLHALQAAMIFAGP